MRLLLLLFCLLLFFAALLCQWFFVAAARDQLLITTTAPTPPRIHRAGSRAAQRYVSSPTGGGPRSTIRDSLPLNPPSEAGFSSISNASRSLSRAKQNVRQRATGG